MKRKITFRKLNHTGHSTMQVNFDEAYRLATQELTQGNYLYLEPQKTIVTSQKELKLNEVEEVLVLPPVIGG